MSKKDLILNATGRRKTASARAFLSEPVKGQEHWVTVNKVPLEEYFGRETDRVLVLQPLSAVAMEKKVLVRVTVRGGGTTGQAGAARHAITRALLKYQEEHEGTGAEGSAWRKILRKAGFVTRDPRVVERKKVGLHKARKATQYSKR